MHHIMMVVSSNADADEARSAAESAAHMVSYGTPGASYSISDIVERGGRFVCTVEVDFDPLEDVETISLPFFMPDDPEALRKKRRERLQALREKNADSVESDLVRGADGAVLPADARRVAGAALEGVDLSYQHEDIPPQEVPDVRECLGKKPSSSHKNDPVLAAA